MIRQLLIVAALILGPVPHMEKLGTTARDGSNFGGELLGPRAMLTARLRY